MGLAPSLGKPIMGAFISSFQTSNRDNLPFLKARIKKGARGKGGREVIDVRQFCTRKRARWNFLVESPIHNNIILYTRKTNRKSFAQRTENRSLNEPKIVRSQERQIFQMDGCTATDARSFRINGQFFASSNQVFQSEFEVLAHNPESGSRMLRSACF